MEQLKEFYSSLTKMELLEVEPKVGLPCVTSFSEDQSYYRALITDIQGPTAKVLYVDYGNEEQAPLSELKRILPCFMQFPKQVRV